MNIQPSLDFMHFDLDKSGKSHEDILSAVMAHHDQTQQEYHDLLKRQRQNPLDVYSKHHVMSYTGDAIDINSDLVHAYYSAIQGTLPHDHHKHNGLQDLIKENQFHKPVTLYSGISGHKVLRLLGRRKDNQSPLLIHVPRHASASHNFNVARGFASYIDDHDDNDHFDPHELSKRDPKIRSPHAAGHILALHLPAGEHAFASEDYSSYKEEKEWIIPHGNIYKIHPNPIKMSKTTITPFGNQDFKEESRHYVWHAEFMGRAEPHEVHAHVAKHGRAEPFNYAEQRVVSRWNIL